MKNIKLVCALLLAIAVLSALCACGDDSQGQPFSSVTNGTTDISNGTEPPMGSQKPSVGEVAVIPSPESNSDAQPSAPDNGSSPDASDNKESGIVLPNIGI